MADEMSSSAWVLMDDDCGDCGGPPPLFNLPPPPILADFPCDMACPNILGISDVKRIGSFPSVTVIILSSLLSFVILLVIAGVVWKYVRIKKKRKGVTQTKDFDHHGPPMMMNGNGVLYEDLSHARPRPPIAPPSIEMLDVNHSSLGSNGMIGNPKMDFSYFLNPPPIYEELPDHSDRNNGPSEDEFAEDELSVIDVPISHDGDPNALQARYQQSHHPFSSATTGRNSGNKQRAQSLTRKRPSRSSGSGTGGSGATSFKPQRSLDRRQRNNLVNGGMTMGNKYNGTATNPRGYSKHNMGIDDNHMLILSNPSNGMTMKIPPHLVAVLTESCNGGARPYEIIPTSMSMNGAGHVMSGNPSGIVVGNGSVLVNGGGNVNSNGVNGTGIYPSSRSSGSSYGEGGSSSNSSARNNPGGNSIESSSFDSGIGPHSITSFINSSAYDQTILPPSYTMNPYEYASAGQMNPPQYLTSQHPSFRRLRMTAADREHPLYSNHLLT